MYWLTGILGFVLMIAPFLFGYSYDTAALWTSIVVGVLIVILAGAKLSMGVGHKTRHVTW